MSRLRLHRELILLWRLLDEWWRSVRLRIRSSEWGIVLRYLVRAIERRVVRVMCYTRGLNVITERLLLLALREGMVSRGSRIETCTRQSASRHRR